MLYFFAILLSVIISFASMAQTPKIHVHANTTIESSEITLGQIADFANFNDDELQFLTTITLADSPSAGKKLQFTNRSIAEIFRRYIEELPTHSKRHLGLGDVRLEVPGAISIAKMNFELNAKQVSDQLVRFETEKCVDCQFKIININLPNMKSIAKNAEWKIRWPNEMLRGTFQLAIEVSSEATAPQTFWASGEIRVLQKVAVLTRALNADDRVQQSDINFEFRDVTFSQDNPATLDKMVGGKLRRPLKANQILWMSDLAREMACKNGDAVELQLAGTDWSVSLRGIAKDNGFVGDVVKVLNPNSNKIVSGIVRSKGVVEVQ